MSRVGATLFRQALPSFLTGLGVAGASHTLGRAVTGEEINPAISASAGLAAGLGARGRMAPLLNRVAKAGLLSTGADQAQKYFQGSSSLDPISMRQRLRDELFAAGADTLDRLSPKIDQLKQTVTNPFERIPSFFDQFRSSLGQSPGRQIAVPNMSQTDAGRIRQAVADYLRR